MNQLGQKIARKRTELGMTQTEFAEKLNVTRQTVGRWETSTVMPDIDKISDIAEILGVSCDYLLKDSVAEETGTEPANALSRLLQNIEGKEVRLNFYEDEADIDLFNQKCTIAAFEGNWMKVQAETKKGTIEKLIPAASVLSVELLKEED